MRRWVPYREKMATVDEQGALGWLPTLSKLRQWKSRRLQVGFLLRKRSDSGKLEDLGW
jgi:hypothetical protein